MVHHYRMIMSLRHRACNNLPPHHSYRLCLHHKEFLCPQPVIKLSCQIVLLWLIQCLVTVSFYNNKVKYLCFLQEWQMMLQIKLCVGNTKIFLIFIWISQIHKSFYRWFLIVTIFLECDLIHSGDKCFVSCLRIKKERKKTLKFMYYKFGGG